ncbi:LrgB family protein [Hwanghaeella grinnelliae]|uniref:LrgB family protein n=1 Tax=Hwanghaeella grinnelliae TaxID=2500179 RepID=A0A3S2VPE3_9PROT|nr:LrgB family protein [Hwanghaeella grinnelliae]RVU36277.1 LrgB family protein [Hwanghaeella grinnelliae]
MTDTARDIWVYLSASPLAGLTFTLVAYQVGLWIHGKCKRHPLVNPVLIAVALLSTLLILTDTEYGTYFEGAQFVHFLLGPATVALAVPLYRQFAHVRRSAAALAVALVVGSLTAAGSAVGIAWLLDGSTALLVSLAPKSATAPIAMAIAEDMGGLPTLTAVLVMLTGIIGAAFGTGVLNLIRVHDPRVQGFALGLASHGIGTARAVQLGETAAAFSGLAMGLNGLATAVLLPLIATFLL